MGSTGMFIVLWTLASVVSVVGWNLIKYVVARASLIRATRPSPQPIEVAAVAGRSLVDAA